MGENSINNYKIEYAGSNHTLKSAVEKYNSFVESRSSNLTEKIISILKENKEKISSLYEYKIEYTGPNDKLKNAVKNYNKFIEDESAKQAQDIIENFLNETKLLYKHKIQYTGPNNELKKAIESYNSFLENNSTKITNDMISILEENRRAILENTRNIFKLDAMSNSENENIIKKIEETKKKLIEEMEKKSDEKSEKNKEEIIANLTSKSQNFIIALKDIIENTENESDKKNLNAIIQKIERMPHILKTQDLTLDELETKSKKIDDYKKEIKKLIQRKNQDPIESRKTEKSKQEPIESNEANPIQLTKLLKDIICEIEFWKKQQAGLGGRIVMNNDKKTHVPTGIGNMINKIKNESNINSTELLDIISKEAAAREKTGTGFFKKRLGRTKATKEFYELVKTINQNNTANDELKKHIEALIKYKNKYQIGTTPRKKKAFWRFRQSKS